MTEVRPDFGKAEHYSNENLRFRKAYIRERLTRLKGERDLLVAEREKIEETLGSRQKPAAAEKRV